MNPWLSPTLVRDLGWTLVHFLWEGLVIAALLAAGLRLFKDCAARVKYLAGCAALALMALAPLVTFLLVAQQNGSPAVSSAPVNSGWIETAAPALPALVVTATRDARAASFSRELEMLFPWLVLGWVAGVCALSGRLLAGWFQVRRLRFQSTEALPWTEPFAALARRLEVSRPVRLLQSALVEVPTVIGWLRPVILLPVSCVTGLAPRQLESIIAHELAHIRRHDYLINLLQSAVETLLFYHPAVWWVSRRIRDEREHCCDDLAVEVCGDRVGYARALATLEELRPASAQLALAAAGAPLLQRIRRLAGQPERSAGRASWPVAGITLLLVLGILAAGMREHRAAAQGVHDVSPIATTIVTSNSLVSPISSGDHTDLVYTSKGQNDILAKLRGIRIDQANYMDVTIQTVANDLARTARARDPDGKGVEFYWERPASAATSTNSQTAPDELDAGSVKVHVALKDVSMEKALNLIVKSADRPIKYAILDYAVVFSLVNSNDPPPLEVRTFHVDPRTFIQAVKSAVAIAGRTDFDRLPVNGVDAGTNFGLRTYLRVNGVDLGTTNDGKVVIFNDRKGTLTVRATAQDLQLIEMALWNLPAHAQEVNIKAKFVEFTAQPGETNAFVDSLGRHTIGPVTGILTDPQFRATINALERRDGTDVLTAPEVTMESGRQAQMQAGEIDPIVLAGKGTNTSITNMFFGVTLDAIATVSADRKMISMRLTPSITQFLGYIDLSTGFTNQSGGRTNMVPRYRVRQTTANVTVLDAQTVVIGGLTSDVFVNLKKEVPVLGEQPVAGPLFRNDKKVSPKKELLIFVTATIINPDGTRYHSEEEMKALLAGPPPAQGSTGSVNSPSNVFPGATPRPAQAATNH